MASSKLGLFLLVPAIFLLSLTVICSDDKDNLLQGLNSYRQSLGLPTFTKHSKADCLADEIADQLEDEPCTSSSTANAALGTQPQLKNYPKLLSKCDISVNTTRDGAILPVCVHNRVPTLVLTNYTRTQYARFLNDSSYVGAGVGSQDDWMVLVLTTNTPGGSFVSAASSVLPFEHWLGLLFAVIVFRPGFLFP